MKRFIEEDVEESYHELIRGNVLNATRYFHHRVTKFIRLVLMADSAPLPVKMYSYKTEFQARGAGHVHGVSWLDTEKLGKLVRNEDGKLVPASEVLDCSAEKPLEGISTPFKKIKQMEPLDDKDYQLLVTLVDAFVTVSIHGPIVGDDVAKIAEQVNQHKHTSTCHKNGSSGCRFRYPRPPAPYTIISRPLPDNMPEKDKKEMRTFYNHILEVIKIFCENKESVAKVMSEFPKDLETTVELHRAGKLARIKMMCDEANIVYNDYIEAITFSPLGYSVVLQRDLDEVYINNYNVEYLRAWNGNMDMQIALDFFSIITYLTEYINKEDTGVSKKMREALKDDRNLDLRDRLKKAANVYTQCRQMGEAEACYRLMPELKLKMSNVTTQFVSTGLKEERSATFRKATEKHLSTGIHCVELDGHEGLWYQIPDFWSKYLRRPEILEDICFAQFARMYRGKPNGKEDEESNIGQEDLPDHDEVESDDEEIGEEEGERQFNYVMTYLDNGKQGVALPEVILLKNPVPGELHIMVKRCRPIALRWNKVKARTEPERFMAKELMMFRPMREELDQDTVTQLYLEEHNGQPKVDIVKAQVMPHLEGVEEARHYVAEALKELDVDQIAALMDGEGLKDNLECLEEGADGVEDIHPDFEFSVANDGEFQDNPASGRGEAGTGCVFKHVELPTTEDLRMKIRELDPFQRTVLDIAVTYFKDIVKSRKPGNKYPVPPLIACQGGAGAGKSTVINLIDAMATIILRRPGDNPDLPVCVKSAFTGCAAVNISGNTLTSLFSLPFDCKMVAMADKTRDTKRALFQNLKAVIVDEMSMVKNTHNELLNFRLGEIMCKRDQPYGGVAIFQFGDFCQLKPVQGKFIFEEGNNRDDELGVREIQPLWKMFRTLTLEKNHRQGSDGEYAELLNKIRKGEHTDVDLLPLYDRIRPHGHPDLEKADVWICPTKAACAKRNKECVERLPGEAVVMKALHHHPTQKNYRPKIERDGTIGKTGYPNELRIKVQAKVMLIANVATADGLCNGLLGTLVAIIRTKRGEVDKLVIQPRNSSVGAANRTKFQHIAHQYPGCVFIEKVTESYSLSWKSRDDGASVKLIQFPVVVAFAITCHKIQGQSILYPSMVAMDLSSSFGPSQPYVMLSRIQRLEQLFIIGKITPDKFFYPENCALKEVRAMEERSMNRNPTPWNNNKLKALRIASLNCAGLQAHYRDLKVDYSLLKADIIHLSETSLTSGDSQFPLPGYEAEHCVVANGKGVSTYFNSKIAMQKINLQMVQGDSFQLSKLTLPSLNSINVYRSSNASIPGTMAALQQLIDEEKATLISGDFNLCYNNNPTNTLTAQLLQDGFKQLVDDATQIQGGLIDHLYWRDCPEAKFEVPVVERISSYYSDHDTLMVTLEPK